MRQAQVAASSAAATKGLDQQLALEQEILKGQIKLAEEDIKARWKVTAATADSPAFVHMGNGKFAALRPHTVKDAITGKDRIEYSFSEMANVGSSSDPASYRR